MHSHRPVRVRWLRHEIRVPTPERKPSLERFASSKPAESADPLKALCARAVHSRSITITSHAVDGRTIVVEGRLNDERLRPTFSMAGDTREPGTIHHMVVRMRVEGPPLVITSVEIEMPGVPFDECRETAASLSSLVGMRIAGGFTSALKKKIGGPRGCAHLNALVLSMAPAAVQGFWTQTARVPFDASPAAEAMETYLVDTCRVWRRDGRRMRELEKRKNGIVGS